MSVIKEPLRAAVGSECMILTLFPLSVAHDSRWGLSLRETILDGPVAGSRSSNPISRVNGAVESLPHPLLF